MSQALSPLMNYRIEQSGPNRCMFESNFPPGKVSSSYNVLFNAIKRLSDGYSASERADLFHDTATSIYRIEDYLVPDAAFPEHSKSGPIRLKHDVQPLELLPVEKVWYVWQRFSFP